MNRDDVTQLAKLYSIEGTLVAAVKSQQDAMATASRQLAADLYAVATTRAQIAELEAKLAGGQSVDGDV